MSDFLANLANRALGRGPTLERRRPSIFETPAVAIPVARPDASADDGERLEPEAIARAHRDRGPVAGEMPAPAQEPESVEPDLARPSSPALAHARSARVDAALDVPTTVAEERRSTIGSRTREIARPIERDVARPEASKLDRSTPAAPDPELDSIRESDDALRFAVDRDRRDVPEVEPRAVRARQSERRAAQRAEQRNGDDERGAEQSVRDGAATPLRPALVALARSTTSAVRRAHGDAAVVPSAERTVHVSIGRIEVRATTAPAPPRKTALAPTTAMSLDEYLRARGGERR